jgi:cyclopropane-fatty-acyl-phospholipid synthase
MLGRTARRKEPGAAIVEGIRRYDPQILALLSLVRRLRRGRLELILPDGERLTIRGEEPGPQAVMRVVNARLVRRFAFDGAVGFAESYIDGDWDSPDLATLLQLLDCNAEAWGGSYYGANLARWLRRARHWLRANSRRGSERNIHAHYDLGNAFFEAWLDAHMLYSAARFAPAEATLEEAQLEKCRRLARRIDLRPGQRLLEIGSGWGSFAILAAKEFGARVTSITISKEQLALAQERVRAEGLEDRVEVRYQDYRDVPGSFDRIASIEMFEAVGEAYWPGFFGKLRSLLAPGGLAGLQLITIADRFFEDYRRSPDFIQRYIFPGGMLPSPAALEAHYAAARLEPLATEAFGADYARTLHLWQDRFELAWERIRGLGFDERFRRIWTYYLAYCEAGFRNGTIDVVQTALRPA